MISNQILQSTIEGLKSIARVDLCVVDIDGKAVAMTAEDMEKCGKPAAEFARSPADSQEIQGYQYFKIYDNGVPEYVIQVKGEDEASYQIGKVAAFQIQSLLVAYKERFDKDNFIKNLLLDNLLLVDIYSRAKKLHIQTEARRVALIIETDNARDSNVLETMRTFSSSNSRDFVTAVDESNVIVVKDLSEGDSAKEIDKTATTIAAFLEKENFQNVRIAYGTTVGEIKDVSRSFKEAKMALDVGKIFFGDRDVIAYSELGIGRLIYQLPVPICEGFLKELFGNDIPDSMDEDTTATINRFLQNNLNIAETSRQLHMHRNTLIYRLDQVEKRTGLDLRRFEDAMTFKIASLVMNYLQTERNSKHE